MANQQTQLQAIGNFSPEDLQVMQQTLAAGTTPAQFNLFIRTAAASGLNPFLNHIYCIVYGGKMSIQVSVEGIVFLAKRVEGYQGIDTQLVHENDDFEACMEKGEWVIGEHKIKFPRGKVIAGYSIAYREGFKPYTVFMDFEEVEHNLTGTNSALWKKYTNDMFKKHLTKRSAKGQFGIEISEDDAPASSADPVPYEPMRRDITQEANQAAADQSKQQEPSAQPEHPSQDDEADKMKQARAKMSANFKALGITEKADKEKYMTDRMKFAGKTPTLGEITGLLKIMDMEIQQKQAADDDDLLGPLPEE
jgi:recombination protein RecT